jgi:recombination protein RecR
MPYPKAIEELINLFSQLPSVGPKTAERYAFYLLRQNDNSVQKLAQAIAELKEKTTVCSICRAIAEKNPCLICTDKNRENTLAVVANTRDKLTLEATNAFQGKYFVLGGLINPVENIKPADLNIKTLINYIKKLKPKEVILALSPTIEGESTAMYLTKQIKTLKIKTSRLARGLPTGANLEYTDHQTLTNALKNRNEI